MAAGAIRYFEDVTGNLTATIFKDAVDPTSLANVRVSPLLPGLPENRAVLEVKRANVCLFVLDFAANQNSLGMITITGAPPLQDGALSLAAPQQARVRCTSLFPRCLPLCLC